jgi:hypothetical protein
MDQAKPWALLRCRLRKTREHETDSFLLLFFYLGQHDTDSDYPKILTPVTP